MANINKFSNGEIDFIITKIIETFDKFTQFCQTPMLNLFIDYGIKDIFFNKNIKFEDKQFKLIKSDTVFEKIIECFNNKKKYVIVPLFLYNNDYSYSHSNVLFIENDFDKNKIIIDRFEPALHSNSLKIDDKLDKLIKDAFYYQSLISNISINIEYNGIDKITKELVTNDNYIECSLQGKLPLCSEFSLYFIEQKILNVYNNKPTNSYVDIKNSAIKEHENLKNAIINFIERARDGLDKEMEKKNIPKGYLIDKETGHLVDPKTGNIIDVRGNVIKRKDFTKSKSSKEENPAKYKKMAE